MKKLMMTLAIAGLMISGAAAQTTTPPAAPAMAGQDAMNKELAPFQGAWQVVGMNGQDASGADMRLVLTGNKYQVVINGTIDESGTFKVDTAKKPMGFDFTILEGNDAGKLQLGVAEITGDTLTCAMSAPGDTTRPASMSADAAVVVVAKKIK